MRGAFALLVLILIAVTIWAVWVDRRPDWRHYQSVLYERAADRLEAELADARTAESRPEVQSRLAAIDDRLAALAADTSGIDERLDAIRTRLDWLGEEAGHLRVRIRAEEASLWLPEVARPYRAALSLLARAQAEHADATGTWPTDSLRIVTLKARVDSLSGTVGYFVRPLEIFRNEMTYVREEEKSLRLEAALLTAERDSLTAERREILAPGSFA